MQVHERERFNSVVKLESAENVMYNIVSTDLY